MPITEGRNLEKVN